MIILRNLCRELGLWIRYFCVWCGLPSEGNPADADVILVQAFGRNQYTDTELYSIAELRTRLGSDIRTIEQLGNDNFEPGKPNQSLAVECQCIMDQYPRLVALVQWEVATAFEWRWYLKNARRIICLWPPATGYFSTVEVTRASRLEMERLHCTRPIELAHRLQIARAFLIVRTIMGIAPIVLEQRTRSFDRFSVQRWTRSWYWWFPREILTRIHHMVTRRVW